MKSILSNFYLENPFLNSNLSLYMELEVWETEADNHVVLKGIYSDLKNLNGSSSSFNEEVFKLSLKSLNFCSSKLKRVEFYFGLSVYELPLRAGILQRPIIGKTDLLWGELSPLISLMFPFNSNQLFDMNKFFLYNIYSFEVSNHAKICTKNFSNNVYNNISNNINIFKSS